MQKILRLVIFLFSVVPTIVFLISFFSFPMLGSIVSDEKTLLEWDLLIRTCIFILLLIALAGYIIYISKTNDSRLSGKKGLWVGLLLFGNILTIPLFWFLYIFKSK